MTIEFRCPHCNATFSVGDEYAGRGAKCNTCQGAVTIPPAALETSTTLETPDQATVQMTCPSCQVAVAAPSSWAGRKSRCNSCGSEVQIPPADVEVFVARGAVDADDSNDDDLFDSLADPAPRQPPASMPTAKEPSSAHQGARQEPWRQVANGLKLVHLSIAGGVCCVLAALAMCLLSLVLPRLSLPLFWVVLLAAFVATGVGIVGRLMCLRVPADSGARPYIIASVVLDLAPLLLLVFGPRGLALAVVASPFAVLAFLYFLQEIAIHLEERALNSGIDSYMSQFRTDTFGFSGWRGGERKLLLLAPYFSTGLILVVGWVRSMSTTLAMPGMTSGAPGLLLVVLLAGLLIYLASWAPELLQMVESLRQAALSASS